MALTIIWGCDAAPTTLIGVLEQNTQKYGVPAMAAVVTRADGAIDVAAAGVRHFGLPDRVSADDRFHLGSCTKAMTATMLATLVEAGKLSWDTTILEIFPEWNDEIDPGYQAVTLADLLSHRAGLAMYGYEASPEFQAVFNDAAPLSGTPVEQRREFSRRVLHRKPELTPRTKFFYSNADYTIACAMAERVTGESWETLMRTRLFAPLGIQATFEWPAFDDPQQPWGHFPAETGVRPHDPREEYQSLPFQFHSGDPVGPAGEKKYWSRLWSFQLPSGGISISAGDYAKFLQLHLQGLEGRDGLLRADTIKRLHSQASKSPETGAAYGLGWGIFSDLEGAPASGHNGSAGTFLADVAIWPSRDLAVAVFANAGPERSYNACAAVRGWAAHHYPPKAKHGGG